MSLIPSLYSNWWEDLEHPHSLLDQFFGHGVHPENLPSRSQRSKRSPSYYINGPRALVIPNTPSSLYIRPWADMLRQGTDGGASTIEADKDQFQVSLDVQQFSPEEINVKVVDRMVLVEGKHEEKQDEHGWISRQFSRRYLVPEQCDIENVVSKLSSDGILSITVPRKELPKLENERKIQIQQTGKPAIRENGEAKSAVKKQTEKEEEKK